MGKGKLVKRVIDKRKNGAHSIWVVGANNFGKIAKVYLSDCVILGAGRDLRSMKGVSARKEQK